MADADSSSSITRLRAGLVVTGLVAICFTALFASGYLDARINDVAEPDAVIASLSDVLDDPATRTHLELLARHAPQTSQRLHAEAQANIRNGATSDVLANLVLRATLFEFQEQAGLLRYAETTDYDVLLRHTQGGFSTLAASESRWCEAREISNLMQQSPADLVDTVLAEFSYGSAAYMWALEWARLYFDATSQAKRQPVRRLPLSAYDKHVLQQQGLSLGSQHWALALKIAAFSRSEGQGYQPMQEVVDSIDICDLAIVAVDLSEQIPLQNRGRIWADLLPEIFAANTPYVFARVTDYFFLTI